MLVVVAAIILAGVMMWSARLVVAELAAAREQARRADVVALLNLFAPGLVAAQQDPRALLVWQPLARTARGVLPDLVAELDRATGATFPFPTELLQNAHARWTADWLAWERTHDATYKRKAVEAQREIAGADPAIARARLDAVEQEKLELYQRRYEEYVRVAKALQALIA